MTRTHTLAELVVTPAAYDEIKRSFEAAGYQHAIGDDGIIDMTGIGVTRLAGPTGIEVMERTTVTHEDGTMTSQVRLGGGDFTHPAWTELFDSAEAYLTWREAQRAA